MGLLFAIDQTSGSSINPGSPQQTTSARIVSTTLEENSLATRLELIGIGIQGFLERPVLGWGQENFARVFDRFADASLYKYTRSSQDQTHNKVVEELTTKGVLGTLAYGALWATLVWAIVRRRRPPREEVLAYAILGALAGYFVQNLFLFDTPAMLLQWTLLVAWVAGQEKAPAEEMEKSLLEHRRKGSSPSPSRRSPHPALQALAIPRVRGAVVVTVALLLGMSLYFLNYRPYRAAQLFDQAFFGSGSLETRLMLAQKSFDTFPPLSTMPRRRLLTDLNTQWDEMSLEDRRLVVEFVIEEGERGLRSDPDNARLIAASLPVLQAIASFLGELQLDSLEPLLKRLQDLAPERGYTYERLAFQELQKDNYSEALRIVEEFEAIAPSEQSRFQFIREAAEEGLNQKPTELLP